MAGLDLGADFGAPAEVFVAVFAAADFVVAPDVFFAAADFTTVIAGFLADVVGLLREVVVCVVMLVVLTPVVVGSIDSLTAAALPAMIKCPSLIT